MRCKSMYAWIRVLHTKALEHSDGRASVRLSVGRGRG